MAMGNRRVQCSLVVVVVVVVVVLMLQWSGIAMGLNAPSSDVVQLSPSNFKATVLNTDGIVLVEFFARWCGHCKALAPAWEKAAAALKGLVTLAALDADAHQSLTQEYGIKGFPTIKVFGTGQQPLDYQGPGEVKGIVEFALGQVKALAGGRLAGKSGGSKKKSGKSASVELTSKDFDELVLQSDDIWLVEFYVPWCGHRKMLAPEWKTAAGILKGKVKLGQVDCDAEKSLMGKYGVQGFPFILLFGADKSNPSQYEGGRVASEIESFALRQLKEPAGAPEVVELNGPDVLDSACSSASICFVTFLPDILDSTAEGRNNYLDILRTVAENFKRSAHGYVWAAAGKQAALEKAVDGGGYGYPALVAVNTKKALYNPLRSAFELDTVVNFVKEAGRGGKGNVPLKSELSVMQTEPWDGRDGQLIEEDEFSLEELMGID